MAAAYVRAMVDANIIIPRSGEVRPDAPGSEQYMQDVVLKMYGSCALPQNIRFKHDPNYKNRVFTLQRAHDKSHWLWQGVFSLMICADMLWFFARMIR